MTTRNRKNALLLNLLLLLLATVLCVLLAETVMRFVKDFKPTQGKPQVMTYDDTLGWIGKANLSVEMTHWGRGIVYNINAWGFRDHPPPSNSSVADKRRVMFLGDSFVEGVGVNARDRVSDVLQSLDSSIASYNFGLGGYSTDQELLILRFFGSRIKPSDVILVICLNDLGYNDSPSAYGMHKPYYRVLENGSVQLENVPVPKSNPVGKFFLWLKKKSILGSYVVAAIGRFRPLTAWAVPMPHIAGVTIRGREINDGNIEYAMLHQDTLWEGQMTYTLLREMRNECRRQGARFTLFTAPSSADWTADQTGSPRLIEAVMAWCDSLNITAIDLYPIFHENYPRLGDSLYTFDKMHWGVAGHRLVAEVALRILNQPLSGKYDRR
jgi:lysophospholipase L1-like esterase